MVRPPQRDGTQESAPPAFPEGTPRTSDMPAYTTQMIFEMNGTLGRIEERLAGLDKRLDLVRADLKHDFDDIDTRFRSIEKHWHWIAGGVAVAIVLVPLCAAIVWYSLGERIEQALQLNTGAISSAPTVERD